MRKTGTAIIVTTLAAAAAFISLPAQVSAHGDVAPQPVDTAALPDIGEEWLTENPWRDPATAEWATAVKIGSSGYNQNCARCHGLEVISGGLAPDLRYLEADEFGDEWYLERFQHGYTQDGTTKMPAFGELLGQKAAWAIKTYIETRPDDGALDDHVDRLKAIRDELAKITESGMSAADMEVELASLRDEMRAVAVEVKTASGAPVADSIASRAADELDQEGGDPAKAAEILTIGLSAAE